MRRSCAGQRLRDAAPAGGEVGARLARLGDARERVRHRLAVDQQDALVALRDFRDVALRHAAARRPLAMVSTITLRFGIVGRTRKMLSPPMPSRRLRITSRCSSMKACTAPVARRQRRRDELREFEDAELLVVVAHRRRVVEHARALALGLRQQPHAGQVLHVERRVLAHQHRVEGGSGALLRRARGTSPRRCRRATGGRRSRCTRPFE
jgi:hypothetical protein